MLFKSAVDWWFYGVVAALVATVLVSVYNPSLAGSSTQSSGFGLLLMLVVAGIPVWMLFTTDYRVESGKLLVRSGLFRWIIPLRDIESVTPSRSWWSSPALSIDRLEIRYGDGKKLLVSPADRKAFLRALGR